MNISKQNIKRKVKNIPRPEFEEQNLTSYSGLVIFQALFKQINITTKIKSCFNHIKTSSPYKHHVIMMMLIMHIILGYRQIKDCCYYQDDDMAKNFLGLKNIPNVATVSRLMSSSDDRSFCKMRSVSTNIVLKRFEIEQFSRVTMDFDGTVQSTRRSAEGTAVGYNKKRKGARSYYPLLCTVAQTSQVFDVYHRPGNVHDSNGALDFIADCIKRTRQALPTAVIESRLDSAFYNESILDQFVEQRIEFTASLPFGRFPELKEMIESRKRWRQLNDELSYFEIPWKPKNWDDSYRVLLVRKLDKCYKNGALQLDLFEPYDYDYSYQVIVTNKTIGAKKVIYYHYGRGSQEGIIGELKSQSGIDYIPFRRKSANQLYLLAGIMAHNLNRELQMITHDKDRNTTEKRSALWIFSGLSSIRKRLIQRAGKITRPQGKLKLTMNVNAKIQDELLKFFDAASSYAL